MKNFLNKTIITALGLALLLSWSGNLRAEETNLLVRVKANDAMFIGTLMGGARIQIREADTGDLMAEGRTQGRVGNFTRVMQVPRARGVRQSEASTASFLATLDISRPTFVEVSAYGPVEYGKSGPLGSTKLWLLPGVHIEGEGLIIELSGLLVDVMSPRNGRHSLGSFQEGHVPVQVNVAMLCGCPITPAMYWDSADFIVKATLRQMGEVKQEVTLNWVAESTFDGAFTITKPGPYEIEITAYEPGTPNTGFTQGHLMISGNTAK